MSGTFDTPSEGASCHSGTAGLHVSYTEAGRRKTGVLLIHLLDELLLILGDNGISVPHEQFVPNVIPYAVAQVIDVW